MNQRATQIFAIVFSVLLVTATLTPATAALDTPNPSTDEPHDTLQNRVQTFLSGGDVLPTSLWRERPPANGTGRKTTTTTNESVNETTTSGGNPNDPGPPNGGNGPPAENESENNETGPTGPPRNSSPGNDTGGPPEDRSTGPPENRGGGPPHDAGGSSAAGDRGPPDWVANEKTPGDVDNRSNLGNESGALADANVNVTVADNASAVDYRLAAIDALQDAEFDGPGRSSERHRTEALEALDDSLPLVLDANRTTSAELFELDKQASTPPKFAENVTRLLVRSDQQLAGTAISDAERVAAVLESRNVSFDAAAVRQNITDAEEAYARAERFRDRGRGHVAISQYRVAWIHAQKALDQMDLAVEPNVTITTHEDMPHEGNVTYEVRGRVFDVRSHELDPLALSLNGVNRTVSLDVNTTPGTVDTFRTNLTLTRQVNRITVSATDPNRRWAPDGDDPPPVTGSDVLRLDADGLPDYYELNTTGTDPLDPDSNSTLTDRNESGNRVIDGNEDFDEDGVSTYYEYLYELEPHDPDTDDDGLTDGFEQQVRGIDPADPDTDNDTVSDAAEDLDGDSLSNLREQELGTSPVRADSDFDGLNDSEEVANGTDPLAADTDDDGLPDADELEVGTDPTVADTDGDGVLDGNETFSTATRNETVGAAVDVTGEGAIADGISVRNETNERIQTESVENASASEVLHFESEREFEQANLTIDYDEERVGDEDDLAVYTYNRTLQTYVKLPSSVDAENDTATGTTPHFSTFAVLNESRWDRQKQVTPDPSYAVDESFTDLDDWNCTGDCDAGEGVSVGPGSSSETADVKRVKPRPSDDGDDEYEIDMVLPGPGGGGGDGCYDADMVLPGPGGGGGGDDSCDDDDDGGDDGDDGDGDGDDGDGDDGGDGGDGSEPDLPPQLGSSELERSVEIPADAMEARLRAEVSGFAEESNASGRVVVVAGGDAETVFRVEGEDGRRVTDSTSVSEDVLDAAGDTLQIRILTENLSNVDVEYVDVEVTRDSDGDGLSNSLERMGILTGDNDRVYTDPYDADTDGDGIPDGQEVGEKRQSGGRTYYLLNSDPTKVDSDGDGLDDYEETYDIQTVEATPTPDDSREFLNALYSGEDPGFYLDTEYAFTDPLYADTDADGLSDGREIELGTNPNDPDTDGDTISDADELEYGSDPTLHDYEGPEIGIFAASYWTTALPPETHYRVGYSASDPSGVTRVQIQKEGDTRIDSRFGDEPRSVSGNRYFTTGAIESSVTALTGTKVSVKATDSHRNQRTMTALERSNFYGSLAKELGPQADVDTAGDLGLLSGFTVGAGGTAETVKAILENPFGFLDSLQQLVALMSQLGLLEKILKTLPSQMAESLQEKQDRSNPYDEETQERHYEAFQYNWYFGYGSYFLLSMVTGQQATKAAKSTETFSKTVDALDRNGALTKTNRYLDSVKGRTTGPAKKAGYKLGKRAAEGSWHLSKRSGRQVLSGVKTASQQYRVAQKLADTDGGALSKIDGFGRRSQQFVGRTTARFGRTGTEFVDSTDTDDVQQMMEMRRAMTDGGSDISFSEARLWSYRLTEIVGDHEVTPTEFGRYLDNLEQMDHETRQDLVELAVESDTASATEAVQFTNDISRIRHTENGDELVEDAVKGNRRGFQGAAHEASYAASKRGNLVDVQLDTTVSRPGDIDVLTEENGQRIGYELKSGSDPQEIGQIASGYEEMIENGVHDLDAYRIVFKREPSAELKQYMDKEGIEYEVY